jgi:chromosomal replication initiator protein
MRIAHEVAVRSTQLPQLVESTVRQRLGKERMDLWFGTATLWSTPDDRTIRIAVATPFQADFIMKMFRSDLQAAVTQAAGTEWGFEVVAHTGNSNAIPGPTGPESPQISYHNEAASPDGVATDTAVGQGGTKSPAQPVGPSQTLPSPPLQASPPVKSSAVRSHTQLLRSDAAPLPPESLLEEIAGLQNERSDEATIAAEREVFMAELRAAEANASPTRVPHASSPSLRVVRDDLRDETSPPGMLAASGADARSAGAIDPADMEMERLVSLRRQNDRRWDDFLQGDHNRFAYTGAQMVLERPGQINPFLIHGPHGVGKSHLAIGLAQRLRQQYRFRRVLVLTGEQFTIEYTESARGGGFASFRRKYRDVEALVIDDIQFCLGKSGTLAELRNTIDMLIRDRRQVILVADRGLHELAGLGADLYARLSGGMCCGIDPMDAATRKRLLANLCLKQNVAIEDSALELIARSCGGDARVIHGIVHRLVAQQRIQGSTLAADDALRCTMDLVRASQPIVRLTDIERAVCEAFGLGEEMLRAKTKCQSISQPRMLAMFLARKYTRTALSEIGEYFGNRQHSTVISAQKKVETWLHGDEAIAIGRNRVTVREIVRSLESTLQVG